MDFQPANGTYRADTALSMSTPGLGHDESSAYAMESTPSALSVGQRVLDKGYSFICIKDNKPCFILPDGGVAVVSSGTHFPYYDRNAKVHDYGDERLPELCGIRIQLGEEPAEGCPVLSFAAPALPVPKGSDGDGVVSDKELSTTTVEPAPPLADHQVSSLLVAS